MLWPFLTRGDARSYHELLQGQMYYWYYQTNQSRAAGNEAGPYSRFFKKSLLRQSSLDAIGIFSNLREVMWQLIGTLRSEDGDGVLSINLHHD